jgi:hypothetical protein
MVPKSPFDSSLGPAVKKRVLARAWLSECVTIARRLHHAQLTAIALVNLGLTAIFEGRYAEATGPLRESLDICKTRLPEYGRRDDLGIGRRARRDREP